MVDWHTQAQVHTLTRPFLSSLNCSTLCAHHNFFLRLHQNASTHVRTLVTPSQCSHWGSIIICKCCDLTRVISHHITIASSHWRVNMYVGLSSWPTCPDNSYPVNCPRGGSRSSDSWHVHKTSVAAALYVLYISHQVCLVYLSPITDQVVSITSNSSLKTID